MLATRCNFLATPNLQREKHQQEKDLMTVKFELFNVFELYYYVLVVDNVAVKPHLQVLAVSTIRKTTKRTLFSVPLTEL